MKVMHTARTANALRSGVLACGLVAGMGMGMVSAAETELGSVMTPIVVEPAKSATLPDLMTKLRSERVIYVGETHTALADHLLQLEVLRAMAARPEGLAIGVEWFQARFQPVLDEYLAGEIDEGEMLKRTEYFDRWRFDYRLYRPIIRFAKDKGIRILALNASRELTGEIRRIGINDLPAELRQELPDSYDVSDKEYEKILRETFKQHSADDSVFPRFLEVQLTWDETMAQNVADYLTATPSGRILVLAGRGHIAGRNGIPNRVTRRTGIQGATIATFAPSGRLFNSADYLVLANEESLPPAGLMRVMLDDRNEGVFIKDFTPNSPAQAAGVGKGDQIVSVNGVPVGHYADVKIAMIDQAPGNEVELNVRRAGLFGREKTVALKFRLAGEGMMQHP